MVADSILIQQYVYVHTVAKEGSAVLPQASLPINTLNICVQKCVYMYVCSFLNLLHELSVKAYALVGI